LTATNDLCNLRSTVNKKDSFASKPSPMELILTTLTPDTERAALIRAFERLEAQLDRVEGQVHKVESHFHQHVLRLVGNHSDLVKLSTQILDQLGGSAAQVDSHPPRPQKRIPRSGSKRQKAA